MIDGPELQAVLSEAARVILVLLIGVLLAFAARKTVRKATERILPQELSMMMTRATFYAILVLTGIAALSTAGINLTALAIAGGFTSLVVSFALQPLLSNFFSGLYLFTEKSVIPGDMISIAGYTGRVMEVSTMSTKVITLDGYMIRVPNSKIIDDVLVNYSKSPVRRLTFKASVAYREDASQAVEVIRGELEDIYLVLEKPGPEIYVSELGDSGVEITVRVWVPRDHWYEASMEILGRVKTALDRAGIEIPFNQVDIWVRTPIRLETS